jgi:hypothetical protein
MMSLISLLFAVVMLVLVGVGVGLGIVAGVLTIGLVAAGVLSSSVAMGLWRGKARAGIRTFVILCGVLSGIPAGMVCAWLAVKFSEQIDAGTVLILAVGGASGAVAGLIVALLFDFIAGRVQAHLSRRRGA